MMTRNPRDRHGTVTQTVAERAALQVSMTRFRLELTSASGVLGCIW